MVQSSKQRLFTAVKRRNKSVYTSIYSYTIPAFGPKNPEFPGIFVSIIDYKNCPIWVFVEVITFGDFIKLYEFYYEEKGALPIKASILHLTKSLRNGSAHNNCILADLSRGASRAPVTISREVGKIKTIHKRMRRNKLSCRPMLEFVSLLYVYNRSVIGAVKKNRINELKELFFVRMVRNKEYFKTNELIKSNYKFACEIIMDWFK